MLVARLVLAALLALAAAAKLARPGDSEATLAKFGVAPRWRGASAVGIPVAGLAIAAALLPAASAPWAGLGAAILLAAFTVGLVRVLRSGEEVDCNCFGALAPAKVSGWTVARNLALIAVAAFVAVVGQSDPGPSAVAWIGDLDLAVVAAIGAGIALLGVALALAFCWQLTKQNGRLVAEIATLRAESPVESMGPAIAPGEMAPSLDLARLGGEPTELDDLLDEGRPLLLFFTDPRCGACDPLLPELARLQHDEAAERLAVVVSLGDPDAVAVKAAEHELDPVFVLGDFEPVRALGAKGFPTAILLDREGRIESPAAVGGDAVAELLAGIAEPLRLIKVGAG